MNHFYKKIKIQQYYYIKYKQQNMYKNDKY